MYAPLPLDDELVDVIPDEPDDELVDVIPDEPDDDDSPELEELAALDELDALLVVLVPGSSLHAPSANNAHEAAKIPDIPR